MLRLLVSVGLVAAVPGWAMAQTEPTSKEDFCQEMLNMSGSLLTQSASVLTATGIEGFEETGEAVASDPRVSESVSSLVDTALEVAKKVTDYCRE